MKGKTYTCRLIRFLFASFVVTVLEFVDNLSDTRAASVYLLCYCGSESVIHVERFSAHRLDDRLRSIAPEYDRSWRVEDDIFYVNG